MYDVNSSVECRRLTEHDILFTYFVMCSRIFSSIKPSEVHQVSSVGEVSHHAFLPWSHFESFETQYSTKYLDIRHFSVHFVYSVDLASVYILVWEGHEQIGEGLDAEFVT